MTGIFEQMTKPMGEVSTLEMGNLSVGGLLEKLEHLSDDSEVTLTNGKSFSGYWFSYRGSYADLALEYGDQDTPPITVGELKKVLHEALQDGHMQGYHGGAYYIHPDTLLWCAMSCGNASGHMVVDLLAVKSSAHLVIKNEYDK